MTPDYHQLNPHSTNPESPPWHLSMCQAKSLPSKIRILFLMVASDPQRLRGVILTLPSSFPEDEPHKEDRFTPVYYHNSTQQFQSCVLRFLKGL